MEKLKILFAGESWFFSHTESKGVDDFTVCGYETEIGRVRSFMKEYADITHIPAHEIQDKYPQTLEELKQYDVVITSDVGANTYLLPPETFYKCQQSPNKLQLIADYVAEGGVFGMMGGYMAYTGFQARGNFKGTVIEEILPVTMLPYDDRQEHSEGIYLDTRDCTHEIMKDIANEWWPLLGYNRVIAKEEAEVIIRYKNDPILAVGSYGKGKTFAWATDCAPHWMSADFCESENNKRLWKNLFEYCLKK